MNRTFALRNWLLLVAILLALLLRVVTAIAFPNILWPDEIFQSLEQAHRLNFGYGIIPWEFRDGTRSWVFPAILAGVIRLTAWMGDGSTGYLIGVTIFLCLFSLIPILVAFFWGYRTSGMIAAILCAGFSITWFELIYFAPKALNEVVAAHLFLLGLYLGIYEERFQPRTRFFLVGCLWGLTLGLRIHLLGAVAIAVAYICYKDWRSRWLPIAAGILGVLLIFGVVDAFTWSYPFQSLYKNVWVNIIEKKSHQYGVHPWYEYLKLFIKNWSLALIPILVLATIGARCSPILAILAIVILLTHSLIAHKEYRFIYPALPMLIILAGLGTAELVTLRRPRWLSPQIAILPILICLLLWTSTSAVLATRYGQDFTSSGLSLFWTNPQTTHWNYSSGNLFAFKKLSHDDTVCGIALWKIDWVATGGYFYLHRNVPIFLIENNIDFENFAPGFNYLLSYNVLTPSEHKNYAFQRCWGTGERGDSCLYKRSNSCTPITGYHINQILQAKGE
jgi:phosphatidylinositol glycan class B